MEFWSFFAIWILAFTAIIAGIGWGIKDKSTLNTIEKAVYIVGGVMSVLGGLVHTFFQKQSNDAVGIPNSILFQNNPYEMFRIETGIANIVIGTAQIVAAFYTETRLLAIIVVCGWGWLLALNHLVHFKSEGYLLRKGATLFGPWPFYASIFFPALLLTLYFL